MQTEKTDSRATEKTKQPFPSGSVCERLNSYVLAAGAAGVAVLACSLPAEGAPVCRKISLQLLGTDTYSLNPAKNLITPFNIAVTFSSPSSLSFLAGDRVFLTPNLPSADVVLANDGLPADLPSGASIGPGGNFGKGRSYGLLFSTGSNGRRGNLNFGATNYFGYRFRISGQLHYGWVRMTATGGRQELTTQIIASGYEASPDTPIPAGACDTTASEKLGAASLGALALGADGIPVWRRK